MKLKIKVKVNPVIITVDTWEYEEEWKEYVEEVGGDPAEGDGPSDEWILERVQEEFEDGTRDLSGVFETSAIDVVIV